MKSKRNSEIRWDKTRFRCFTICEMPDKCYSVKTGSASYPRNVQMEIDKAVRMFGGKSAVMNMSYNECWTHNVSRDKARQMLLKWRQRMIKQGLTTSEKVNGM